jgi:hypothetical protein
MKKSLKPFEKGVCSVDKESTQQQKFDYHANKSPLKLVDFWHARPGPHDQEAAAKYLKPYLSKRESKVMFLHLGCGLTFKDISQRMHVRGWGGQGASGS